MTQKKPPFQTLEIAVSTLIPSKANPRKYGRARKAALASLVKSIKSRGVVQPLTVRNHPSEAGKYLIVAGERRWRAAEEAGLGSVPCQVRDLSDGEAAAIMAAENLEREDLTPMETAQAIQNLRDAGLSIEQAALEIGWTPASVAQTSQILRLTPKWKAAATKHDYVRGWSTAMLAAVARLTASTQDAAYKDFMQFPQRNLAELEKRLQSFAKILSGAPWKLDDATIDKDAGPCSGCPKRMSEEPLLFDIGDEQVEKDRCLDSACWDRKAEATVVRQLESERKKGKGTVYKISYEYAAPSGVLNRYAYERVDAKTKGAVRAIVVDGATKGHAIWIAVHAGGATRGRSTGKPKTLAERRKSWKKRRVNYAAARLFEIYDAGKKGVEIHGRRSKATRIPAPSELLRLVILVGTSQRTPHPGSSPDFDQTWTLTELQTIAWQRQFVPIFRERIAFQWADNEARLHDLGFFAPLCGLDFEADLWKPACEALPDPKSWAKLNADGTPKTLAKKKAARKKQPSKKRAKKKPARKKKTSRKPKGGKQ
jgi:ParB/RepB/Spo0J family partition protein